MIVLTLFSLCLMQASFTGGYYLEYDFDFLTKNLFENLKADPILLGDEDFSEDSKAFIDKQVANYMNLITKSEESEFSRSKRSLQENITSENYFIDIKPFQNVPVISPKDMVLFQQNMNWYAASLETEVNKISSTQHLKIRKLENGSSKEVAKRDITNGVRVAVFSLNTSTIITVAENSSARQQFQHLTSIMRFNSKEELETIQRINISYASHVEIWEQNGKIYMAVAQFMKKGPSGTRLKVDSPIYRWQERYFDLIQFIGTSGALKVSPFSIRDVHYLAVANSQSDNRDSETYSEIFKYDVQEEKYKIHQKILTYGCKDIKLLQMQLDGDDDYFLVVANNYKNGNHGSSQDVPSIIYKFVDNYFIPFQSLRIRGVNELQPVTVETGEVLLFAATTFDGIKCFHYNGWHFVESQIESKNEVTSSGIKAMHFYKYQDKSIVVIANENDKGNMDNMVEISFSSQNELKTMYNEMLTWCVENKKNVEKIDETDNQILGISSRGDISVVPQNLVQEPNEDRKRNIEQSIHEYSLDLDEIEDKLNKSLILNFANGDIKAKHVIINNDAIINSIETESVNNFKADIFENILDINNGFKFDSIEFNVLSLEDSIHPQTINDLSTDIILQRHNLLDIENLVVDGTVKFLNDLNIQGVINNVTIHKNRTLLKNGDQTFEDFNIKNVEIDGLETKFLNNRVPLVEKETIKSLKELKVDSIITNGFINDIDLTTLEKYVLRINGNQKISKSYYFDKIEANNLDTNTLLDKQLDDFIIITHGKYKINRDVKFIGDLSVNNLKALNYLDSIPVKNGKLDILRKDSTERQYISGVKSFENLELLNPIQLRGKIRSKVLDTMNPRVNIDTNLDLNGDIRITGNVIAEEIIKSNDVVTSDGSGALLRVQQQGLKLTDTEIPIRLSFVQHINVEGVFVDRINNIDPRSWVVNGAKQAQSIRGWKQFRGDLEITGDTGVFRINDIDIAELEKNVLAQNGDQVISGRHHVKMVVAEKGIKSENIEIGSRRWNNVITSGDQTVAGTTIFTNLSCETTRANSLKVHGFVNGLNISEIFDDVATRDTAFKIFSHKTFNSITIENLKVKNNHDFINQATSLNDNSVTLLGGVDFNNEITINNIRFKGSCNGVEKKNFAPITLDDNGFHLIQGNQEFDTIKVFGRVYVDSNLISTVNLSDIANNTVKIDEPFDFDTVTFKEIIVNGGIDLDGQVENLDIDNIFQNNNEGLQTILDEIVFKEDLIVDGTVNLEYTVNEFNITHVCGFASDKGNVTSLIIEGNAHFAKGPHVAHFNEFEVNNLEDSIWFNDKPAIASGYIEIKNNATFKDDIIVMEQINGINLKLIETNYLSKSRNQTVTANLEFSNEVLFVDDIHTTELKLDGVVNEIDIDHFVKSILLNDEQSFENIVYLETCRLTDVQGNYLVNGLDFETDVMRYDKPNVVSGHKVFKNLDISNLKSRNLTIQDVDIIQWIQKGVFTGGNGKISGRKQFKNITLLRGISVEGLLNGQTFDEDTVMLQHVPQNITGRKMFLGDAGEGVSFKALKIKGLVNDVDVVELAHNQAIRTENNIFKSEIHFHGNILTKNVVLNDLYDGVNVTELLKSITTLGVLNKFEEQYEKLQDMSKEVENSLAGQAYFIHFYKSLLEIPHAAKIFGKRNDQGDCQIMVLTHHQNAFTELTFFDWNEKLNMFEDRTGYAVNLGTVASFIDQITIGRKEYIYFENEVNPLEHEGYPVLGKLIHFHALTNTTKFEYHSIPTKGTIFTTTFELAMFNQYCILFINYELEIHINCINLNGEFYLLQMMNDTSLKASVITIDKTSYLVTIKKEPKDEEPPIKIWKFNNDTSLFELYQTIYGDDPISLTTITYNSGHYIAVAYGHMQNTMHLGRVVIWRFDTEKQEFDLWQNIQLGTSIHVEFSVLPSEELVLYILTQNPSEPFNVYAYEGISGFSKKIVGSAIPQVLAMNQFSINNKHFVVTQHYGYVNIIQAIFKGERLH